MFGLDLLAAGSLVILAGGQADFCKAASPAKINVIPKTKEIDFDYSQKLAEIQGQAMDTIDPYGFHGMSQTQGFMQGAIKMVPRIKIATETYSRYKAACLWYEEIDIQIEIDPKIVIAKEVNKDLCMGKAVRDHEMKHINADRKIVNKYSRIMGQKVYNSLKGRFVAGPIRIDDMERVGKKMQETVFQIVKHEYKKMELERIDDQRAIDSLEEYERVDAQCPDFDATKKSKKRNKW